MLVSVGLLSLFVLSSALTRMTPDAAHRESFAMIVREPLSPASKEPLGAFCQFPHHLGR